MNLDIVWLNRKNYQDYRKPGLLVLIENRKDLFCDNPMSRIEVLFVNLQDYQPLWDNYQMVAFIHGFEIPYGKVAIGKELQAEMKLRGDPNDGNFRAVYIYSNEETDIGVNVGLTVHMQNGSWSNVPWHPFELDAMCAPTRIYPDFLEKFVYITEQPNMWGITGYSNVNGERKVYAFADKDIITVPLGPHFSIAMPGQKLAYIWAYVNGGRKD